MKKRISGIIYDKTDKKDIEALIEEIKKIEESWIGNKISLEAARKRMAQKYRRFYEIYGDPEDRMRKYREEVKQYVSDNIERVYHKIKNMIQDLEIKDIPDNILLYNYRALKKYNFSKDIEDFINKEFADYLTGSYRFPSLKLGLTGSLINDKIEYYIKKKLLLPLIKKELRIRGLIY